MAVTQIKYETPITTEIEKKIQDRLFNGFRNWNGGYDGWLKWCDTLYEPESSIRNSPGAAAKAAPASAAKPSGAQ